MLKQLLTSLFALTVSLMPVGISAQVYLSQDFSSINWSMTWDVNDVTPSGGFAIGWQNNMLGRTGSCAAVQFMQASTMTAARLKSTPITIPSNKDLQLSFWLKNTATLNIYVSTDGGVTYPATNKIFTSSGNNTAFTQYEASLSAYKGQTVTLVFEGEKPLFATGNTNVAIDDILVEALASCQFPENAHIEGLTSTTATMLWSLNTRSGSAPDYYQLRLKDEADTIIFSADSVVTPILTYTFTGLTANTTYTAYVNGYCTMDGSTDTASCTFTTIPTPINPPFYENFDNMTAFPKGYYVTNAAINATSSITYGSTGRSVSLSTTITDGAMIVFPSLNIAANDIDFSFSIRRGANETSSVGVINYQVGYLTDPSDATSFAALYTAQLKGDVSWHDYRFNSSTSQNSTTPVMPCILVMSGYSTQVFIDNINIRTVPNCIRPENLAIPSLFSDSAILTWNTSVANDYNVYLTNLSDLSIDTFTTTQSAVMLSGLQPNTSYVAVVQAICSATDSSELSLPITFATLCAANASPVFHETFDQIVANTAPDCWQMGWTNKVIGSLFVNAPFTTSSTYTHASSAKAMTLVAQNNGSESYLVSRPLNLDSAGAYDLSIWVYRQNASARTTQGLQLWITDSPNDTTGGLMLDYIHHHYAFSPAEYALGWYQYIYNIPVSGTKYLMIRGISEQGTVTYFDDLEIMAAPTCRRVKDFSLDSVTSSSAAIHWTGVNGESQWAVNYTVISGTQPLVADTTVIVSSPNYTITGLAANTEYTINGTIRAICQAGDTSMALDFIRSVITECEAISVLPYTTSFEDTDKGRGTNPLPMCWTRYNDSSSGNKTYPYNYNYKAMAKTGTKVLYFTCTNATNNPANELAIMPELNTTLYPINTLRLKFYGRKTAATGQNAKLFVGVMSDPADITTFVTIDSVMVDSAGNKQYEVDFPSYSGQGKYIALRFCRPAATTTFCLDDLTLEVKPTCVDLAGTVTVDSLTYSSARITPEDSTAATGWSYAYGPADADFATYTIVDTFGTSVVINGLESALGYNVYVRRVCGTLYGTWSEPVTFTTVFRPASMPYTCDFENEAENRLWQYSYRLETSNRFNIGSATNAVYQGEKAIYVSNSNGDNYNYNVQNGGDNYAYRKMHFDNKGYQVVLHWKCTGGQTTWDFGRVMIVPDSSAITYTSQGKGASTAYPTGAIFLDPEGKTNMSLTTGDATGWNTLSYYLDMTERAGDYNFALLWTSNAYSGSQYPLAIDDISITELSCIPPTRVTVDSLTTTSATLSFSQSGVSKWEVIVDSLPFTNKAIPAAPLFRDTTTTGSVSIDMLQPNHQYYYSVRAICSEGDTSAWRAVDLFLTPCSAFTVPYFEDFESPLSDKCWTVHFTGGSSSKVQLSTAHFVSGVNSLNVVSATAITPEILVDSMANHVLNGWVYATADSTTFSIGVIVDPSDISTYESMGEIMVPAKNKWIPFSAFFSDLSSPEYSHVRNAKYIALVTTSKTFFFDNISIEPRPACSNPTEISISNIGAHQVDLAFRDNAGASSWLVRFNDEYAVLNSNPGTLTGLEPSKTYEIYVAALCNGGNDTSAFSYAGTIFSGCDVIDLPWSTGFEKSENFPNTKWDEGILEKHCWTTYNASAGVPRYQMTGTAQYVHSGSQALYTFTNSNAILNRLYLFLPEFSHPTNMLSINFWYRNGGITENHSELVVGYVTNAADTSTFVPLDTLERVAPYTEYTINTTQYPQVPASARMALVVYKDSLGLAVYIDDLSVSPIFSCSQTTTPVAGRITDTSALITFTDTCASHNAWEYIIGTHGFNRNYATPVAISDDEFTITGLNPDTEYDVYVRAVCDTNDHSAWVKCEFSTLCSAVQISPTSPFLDSFEYLADNQSLGGCYRLEGNTGTYTIRGKGKARTGSMGLQAWTDTTYSPRGLTAYRYIHLEAGHTYRASIWTSAISSFFQATLYLGPVQNIDSMNVLATLNVPACTPATQTATNNCWNELKGFITVPETGDYFIAFNAAINQPNNIITLYFDDLEVRELEGCTPSVVTVDSVALNTAICSIADTSTTNTYEYVIIEGSDTITSPVPFSGGSFIVTGLQNSTEYTVAVRHNCGDDLYSPWSTATFSTACGIRTLYPVTESFEGTSFPPVCWSQFSYGSDSTGISPWRRATNNIHSGKYAAYCPPTLHGANTALVSCAYDFNSPTGYILSLWMYRGNTTAPKIDEALHIYYSSEVVSEENIAMLNEIGMINTFYMLEPVESRVGVYKYQFYIPATITGPNYLVFDFHGKQGIECFIDDITLEAAPTCVAPLKDPVVVDYTMTTANLSIDLDGHAEAELAVSLSSAPETILGSTVMTQNSTTVTNLSPSTHYIIRYRYICSVGDTSAWSEFVDFTTTATDCFAPINLRLDGMLDDHHAEVTWGAAPNALGYGYEFLQSGLVIASGNVTTNRIVFDTLDANTQYTIRVRTYCLFDTTDWRTFSFTTTFPTYQLPYICDFEDLNQNAGWKLVHDTYNPLTISTDANGVRSGSRALYVTGDGQTYSYSDNPSQSSAEVVLSVGAGHYLIDYDWRIEGDSANAYGRMFLAPSTTDMRTVNFVTLRGNLPLGSISLDGNAHLSGSTAWKHHREIIKVTNAQVYKLVVAFLNNMYPTAEPGLAIDNISIVPITCLPADDVEIFSVNSNDARAVITRRDPTVAIQYGISHYDSPDSVAQWTTVSTVAAYDTIVLTGLRADYDYNLFVRHYCSTTDQSPEIMTSFRTPSNAVSVPYVCSFELTESLDSWVFTTGGATNTFTIGTALATNGNNSLYISDNGFSHNYNITSESWSYAFVPVIFAEGQYSVSFDWSCNGQNTADYARVFLAPASTYPTGNIALPGVSYNTLPADCMPLDGGTQLALSNQWNNILAEVEIDNAGTYQFIVCWTNDNYNGQQTPIAIDNIQIKAITCPRISADSITVETVTENTVTLRVNSNNTGASLYYEVAADNTFSTLTTSGSVAAGNDLVTVNGLAASSWYFIRLYSVCQSNDTSFATSIKVHTLCGTNDLFPYNEDFESFAHGQTERTQLSDNCWLTYSSNIMAYHYMIYSPAAGTGIGSSISEYIHGGEKALCIYNNVGTANTQTLALPKIDDLNNKVLSFWYRHPVQSTNNLYVGYLTNADSISSFVQTDAVPLNTVLNEYSFTFTNVPAGARPAIRAVGNGYVYLDDIRINNIVNGGVFYDTICFDSPYNAHGFSKSVGSLNPGDHTLVRTQRSTTVGVSDSIITAYVHMRNEIAVVAYDTVCKYQPYVNALFNIPNPISKSYTQHGVSVNGCDSSVVLNLTVHETFYNLFDTICMGTSYPFFGQNLTVSGDYTHVAQNGYGCNDTVSLHLNVVDTAMIINQTICQGASYQFEGRSLTQSGTYTATVVGSYGCPLVKTLHLTVLSADSTVNVAICQGGTVQVADTFITEAGQYTLIRSNPIGCYLTYHITVTVNPVITGYAADYVCEGDVYNGHGIHNLVVSADTTIYVNTRTSDASCDSVGEVFVHYVPTVYTDEYAKIAEGDVYEWNNQSYTKAGDYPAHFYSSLGCDSIVTLHLSVGDGVETISDIHVDVVPNPVKAGVTAYIYGNFDEVFAVEILNNLGQVVESFVPQSYPIEVSGISAAGLYYVRVVTGDGKVNVQKLLVK